MLLMQRNDLVVYREIKNFLQNEQLEEGTSILGTISPTWFKRFEDKQSSLSFAISLTRLRWLIEIIDAERCVVGEAYGFSSSYIDTCKQCTRIANKFSLYFALCCYKRLRGLRQTFVEHWIANHTRRQ